MNGFTLPPWMKNDHNWNHDSSGKEIVHLKETETLRESRELILKFLHAGSKPKICADESFGEREIKMNT